MTEGILGILLLILLVVLGILLYFLFVKKNGTKENVVSVDEEHYLEGEELLRREGITFAGAASAGFFGKMSVVRRVGTDEHGLCLFPAPDLVDEKSCRRFTQYAEALSRHPIEGIAPFRWWRADHNFIGVVQGELVRSNGHIRMTLREYLLDRTLNQREKEGTLLAIAHVLKSLHAQGLYHGWLLPRSLFVALTPERIIRGIRVADGGLAYAFSQAQVYERLQLLHARETGMDAYRRHRLLNELVHLSPEQKKKDGHVGPESDFYAFGSLAARLFSEAPLWGSAEIDWDKVPEKWRTFLQACLSDNRPTSFDALWQNS